MVPRRQVSLGRKIAFYLGYLSMAVAGLLLLSPFLDGFPTTASRIRSLAFRVLGGLALLALGLLLRRVAIRGLAGSLVTLDPPGAREDLEPWSRAAGGLLDAALSEVEVVKDAAHTKGGRVETMVHCPRCQALNDKQARFCDQCAAAL